MKNILNIKESILLLKGAQTLTISHNVVLSEGFLWIKDKFLPGNKCLWMCYFWIWPVSALDLCFSVLIPRIASSSEASIVLPWVACEAGYSACLQLASEPALKLYTCDEKRSRHFSAVCLDQFSLWRLALFESSSVGELFLGPWLALSLLTQWALCTFIYYCCGTLLRIFSNYIRSHSNHSSFPCCRFIGEKMQLNQGEMHWNTDPGRGLQELDCGADKFHIEQVNMFLSCYPACTLTHGVWRRV